MSDRSSFSNLSRSLETCRRLKIILSKQKFIKNIRISDHAKPCININLAMCTTSNMKSSSHKT